jgi:hypothetical protein
VGLTRKNGTLKGVDVWLRLIESEWEETKAVGWRLGNGYFIGIGDAPNGDGHDVEIYISSKTLRRMVADIDANFIDKFSEPYSPEPKTQTFSDDSGSNFDWLEGDFPT